MPVDPRSTSASRISSGKLASEEEIELKRARGEISCAECRRSKLKCDKVRFDSNTSIKFRIHQNNHMNSSNFHAAPVYAEDAPVFVRTAHSPPSPVQGLSCAPDTEQLHRKISEMGQRIRQLEDALAILQSSVSTEPHPLLEDGRLSVNSSTAKAPDVLTETMDAFGTLTIGDSGESKYFGPSAGSEASANLTSDPIPPAEAPELLTSLAALTFEGKSFPTGSETFSAAMTLLFAGLPPRQRAWSLCETYLEHSSWIFQLVLRSDLIEDVLTPIYNAREMESGVEHGKEISPHKLAFLYLVFAQAVLVDLTLPAYHEDGETFHYYARAALALRSFVDAPTIETVQAVLQMAHYRSSAGERYTKDSVWALLSLGCKLAQSIGMHRDPARWHMDEKTAECRRRLFWEVYTADLFHSLTLGRPPSIELSYVDCGFPKAGEDSNTIYWNWKYQFVRNIFGSVVKITLAASPPPYKQILELDRKVREMVLPPALNVLVRREDNYHDMSASVYLKSCLLSQFRWFSMLYIHRSFFVQALLDHPENPLKSVYATSFLAAYRSASVIIRGTIGHLERWWAVWTQLFSAAIIVGSIATKAPSSSMASTAFIELGLAVDLFERCAGISERARSGVAILQKLKEKAFLVLSQYRGGGISPSPALSMFNSQEDGTDELALFGGQTRVVVSKTLSAKSPEWHFARVQAGMPIIPGMGSLGRATSSSDISPTLDTGIQEVHPSLVQYMSLSAPVLPSTDLATANYEPRSLDQSTPSGPTWDPASDFSQATPMNSSALDPSSSNLFREFYEDALSANTAPLNTWGSNDYTDLGMMMNTDSQMDEQWMAFMNDSGMGNSTTYK
ncbi:hypothetical protein HWV62_5292 [Athelia sp. TMB]|nr:hypothetical protein HWV62_5292 [Athelia sp. TMB]